MVNRGTLKLLLTAGVFYAIADRLLGNYLKLDNNRSKAQESQQAIGPNKDALKLQAYERLVLYSDRISIPKLIRRIKIEGMTAGELKRALYIAIQQEYDHNITQQINVSGKLWSILDMTRQQILARIIHGFFVMRTLRTIKSGAHGNFIRSHSTSYGEEENMSKCMIMKS